jgi:hypothetical protein
MMVSWTWWYIHLNIKGAEKEESHIQSQPGLLSNTIRAPKKKERKKKIVLMIIIIAAFY